MLHVFLKNKTYTTFFPVLFVCSINVDYILCMCMCMCMRMCVCVCVEASGSILLSSSVCLIIFFKQFFSLNLIAA